MKDSSGPCKTKSRLPESVRHQFKRLSIAVILAGVSLFVLAWPAEAEVVYTKVHISIGANSSYNLDINKDGITDFTISASVTVGGVCSVGGGGFYRWYITSVDETPASGNGVIGSPPAVLSSGDEIGPSQTFYGGTGILRSYFKNPSKCGSSSTGNWVTHSIHYLGLTFEIDGETYYGWAKLKVDVGVDTASATLLGYAYENTAGMSINAGQTTDSYSSQIPGPASHDSSMQAASVANAAHAVSLDPLATGAELVPLLRGKESAAAASENR